MLNKKNGFKNSEIKKIIKSGILVFILTLTIFILTGCSNKAEIDNNKVTMSAVDRIYSLDPQRQFIGKDIEDMHFIDINTDKQIHFDEINKNKVVMIQSFSNGCPACVRGIAEYNELYEKYDIEVIYLDINPDDSQEVIKSVKKNFNGGDWIWADYQGTLLPFYETYKFRANDMTFIIDKGGKIVYADSFSVPRERLENELEKLGV